MSFIQNSTDARVYAPGWFLADNENCERKTRTISATGATTTANGGKYVKMGTIYPSNDANAIGIVYEDIDVTTGDMPGSVVLKGTVYTNRLHTAPATAAQTALESKGFKFVTEPEITRP